MVKMQAKWVILALMVVLIWSVPALCSTVAEALDNGIAINAINFPDPTFRAYVAAEIDKNRDGVLSAEEIIMVSRLDLRENSIASLHGLEYFTRLMLLDCSSNQLTELDVSKNINLSELLCSNNQLTELDVNNNTNLEWLYCYNNQLTELDISKNVKLKHFGCEGNKLTKLDVCNNAKLESLYCGENQLTALDVSRNNNMELFSCVGNQLTELDISNNIKLSYIDCSGNLLTDLDISKNINLERLICRNNQLAKLNTSSNIILEWLYCNNNQLTELDVRENIYLKWLECYINKLADLDISKNINFENLDCSDNQLTKLEVSKNINLKWLYCSGNQLTALDVSKNTNLKTLYCYNNPLEVAGWLPFIDVSESDWFIDDVRHTFYNNLISGINILTFSPNIPATRTVLVTALYRHADYPNTVGIANPFSDVSDDGSYSTAAIRWAAANGIVTGRGDGTFDPEGSITRQDLAVIFLRYMKYAEINKPVTDEYIMFADEAQISDYAKEAMQTLHNLGIIQGVGGNAVDPKGTATRAQLAAMLRRFIELVE